MGTGRRQTAFRCCALAASIACCLIAIERTAVAQILTAVVSDPSNVKIKLEPIATLSGLVPIDGAAIAGDDRLYIGTYIANSASVRVVDPVSLADLSYVEIASLLDSNPTAARRSVADGIAKLRLSYQPHLHQRGRS